MDASEALQYMAAVLKDYETKNARLKEALDSVTDFAEDWYVYYCETWGQRKKKQQEHILDAINKARTALGEE